MRKIFVSQVDGNKITLTGDNHNHLAYSMRSRIGDEIIACCDKIDYQCVIERISKNETVLSVVSSTPVTTEPKVDITLFPAILKGDKMEFVVQKTTELGVVELRPFVSKNCECRVTAVRIDRLKKIAEEASKQCGRGIIPKVFEVVDFAQVCEQISGFDLVVFPYENATKPSLKDFLKNKKGKKIAIIIGSEGGFTNEEVDALISSGALPVTLGKRILRAETASVAVCAVVAYEMDEWSREI